MIKWAKALFGSSDVVEKLVDEAVNSKDEQARILATERLKALAPFKIVQRIMVGSVMMVWVPWSLITIGFAASGHASGLEWMLTIAKEEMIFYPVAITFAAYLGGGTIESFKGIKK